MRITLVISSLAAGGAQRVMVDLAAWLVDRGHDVSLVTYSDPSADHFSSPPKVNRVALRLLWDSNGPADVLASNVRRLRTMRATISELRSDVVISFIDITNVLTLLSTLGLGVPVIISERIHPTHHPIGLRWRLLRRLTYPMAAALVVQTQQIAAWARFRVAASRVNIVPNPLPCREWPKALPREKIVIGVGRLHRQKGFDLLIQAFARSGLSAEWRLVLIGEGPERTSLWNQANALGLEDRVHMPGEVPDPEVWLARAAVFALASRYEGFPNVVLEAMACGTPVIAFDCPTGPRDILSDETGVLLPAQDVDALASALRRLADDPAARTSLALAASKTLSGFSPERINQMWLELMINVAGKPQVAGPRL